MKRDDMSPQALGAHVPCPSEATMRKKTGRAPSEARMRVQQTLQAAHSPLTRQQMAALAGVDSYQANTIVSTLVAFGLVHGIDGTKPRAYLWGPAPVAEEPQQNRVEGRSMDFRAGGSYDGRELQRFAGRPGAMDAFDVPSREGNERKPRRAPAPICSQPPERATW